MNKNIKIEYFSLVLNETVEESESKIRSEVKRRSFMTATELKNASQKVLSGRRHGKKYRVYNGRTYREHQASAPGEPPALSSGILRLGWRESTEVAKSERTMTIVSAIQSNVKYAGPLEYGRPAGSTNGKKYPKIAARPYRDKIRQRARPFILDRYGKVYD